MLREIEQTKARVPFFIKYNERKNDKMKDEKRINNPSEISDTLNLVII